MSENLVGRTLGVRFRITALLAGEGFRGIYHAEDVQQKRVCLLICIPDMDGDRAWISEVSAQVTPLIFADRVIDGDLQLRVLVEPAPAGNPLLPMLSVATNLPETSRILAALSRITLGDNGHFWALHPAMVYLHRGDVVRPTGWAALLGTSTNEWPKPLWEPTIEAPELLTGRGNPRTEASTVFSLCALGAWLSTGKPPFGSSLLEELKTHFYQPERAAEVPLPILLQGLRRNPGERPRLAALLAALEAPTTSMIRRLLEQEIWFSGVQLGVDGPEPRRNGGTLTLFRRRQDLGDEGVLELPGLSVFSSLPVSVQVVEIDPGLPEGSRWTETQLLRRWAQAMEVERVLEGRSTAPLKMLRDFAHYQVVVRTRPDGGQQLAMAPDPKNRRLAAVFTADDTRDAFLRSAAGTGLQAVTMNGEELFGALATMPLDGIVFNCAGPVATKAVALDLARLVLAS